MIKSPDGNVLPSEEDILKRLKYFEELMKMKVEKTEEINQELQHK